MKSRAAAGLSKLQKLYNVTTNMQYILSLSSILIKNNKKYTHKHEADVGHHPRDQ